MYSPVISVCIAVYNRQKFIQAAIESVLNQTYQNFEVIIIDDGSKDGTVSVIESIADSRIKLFKNESNKGVVYTRNRYLELASGEFIAILDSDDLWFPEKLEKQLHFFASHQDYGICGTTARKEYENGKIDIWKYPSSDSDIRSRLLWGSAMVHSSVMLRKKIIDLKNFKYDCTIKQAEDYDFIRQFVSVTKAYNIETVLTRYAVHNNQFTTEAKDEQVNESIKVAYRYFFDIGIILSEIEKRAFYKLYTYTYQFNIEELIIVEKLFHKIIDLKPDFIKSIKKQWFLACYNSSQNGIKTFVTYHKKGPCFRESLFSVNQFKFFIRCIIRKK
jgi:glycosyltransferase involved in cell wall biosynthesis